MTNLVITGFMGTGKTTVGQEVARRLGWDFIDMDQVIEERAGKSITSIFAEDGEIAFREMEAQVCQELSTMRQSTSTVIATGGGTLVNPQNRKLMLENSTVVCLTCETGEILHRLNTNVPPTRPLLAVDNPYAEIEKLRHTRQAAYDAIPWQVDTTGLSIGEITAQVSTLADLQTLQIQTGQEEYPIYVGQGILTYLGGLLTASGIPRESRIAVVSNPTVAALYREPVLQSLRQVGFQPCSCTIPDGEAYKTLDNVARLYDQFLEMGLDRSGTVLALGGGVTGDMAGFAAATFMRGVRFIQVPTTLLAMVDASIGGKTGVDLPQGKNLVGAFKQPELVFVDTGVLATLPVEEIRSGMAEVIKHGILDDNGLFDMLQSGQLSPEGLSPQIVAQAIEVKAKVVSQDPLEQGLRITLNLGHTVGHALESLSNYQLRHGEGVAIGLVAATRIAVALGYAEIELVQQIVTTLEAWGLPTQCPPFSAEEIMAAMAHDKKHQGKHLRWVLPCDIGEVKVTNDVPRDVVEAVLCKLGARKA